MGTHLVDGDFVGLGKQKEPPITVKITGSLRQSRNAAFRSELVLLAKKFGLHVDPPFDDVEPPLDARKKARKKARKTAKKRHK
jgi:hypothetical protein